MWLIRQITLPYWRLHGARTLLTLLGVTIGVAAIVATKAVTASVFIALERVLEATAGGAELHVTNDGGGIADDLAQTLASVPGVASAAPLVEGFVSPTGAADRSLAVFGVDFLAGDESRLPRSAVELPDALAFVAEDDSIALSRSWAAARGYDLGAAFDVSAPVGTRRLIVRGLIEPVGPATLFGGDVGVMDLLPAQRLLGKQGRVDRVDIRLSPGASSDDVATALATAVAEKARVETSTLFGRRAQDSVQSLRVMLALAGLIATAVAFFIVYHTVTVAISQRRRHLALLSALGVSRRSIVLWLVGEVALLGGLAAVIGTALGIVLARLSLASVTGAVNWWLPVTPSPPRLSVAALALGVGVGLGTTVGATLLPIRQLTSARINRFLHFMPQAVGVYRRPVRGAVVGVAFICAGSASLAFGPVGLSYPILLAYVLAANSVVIAGFALVSPALARLQGGVVNRLGVRTSGVSLLLAGSRIAYDPSGPLAVVAAITIGISATLTDASLVASLEQSWLGWLEQYYDGDLIVSAGSAILPPFASPPFDEAVAAEVSGLPGVREVQALRALRVFHRGLPIVIEGFDVTSAPVPLLEGRWQAIAASFWEGQGVLVSDNLQHRSGLQTGDRLELPTPNGALRLPVLGIVSNFHEADSGSVLVSRVLLRRVWNDSLVNRIRVWTRPDAAAAVREAIEHRFGRSHGLRALTAHEFRAAAAHVLNGGLAMIYALVLIAFAASFVGIVNFLLAAIADRAVELKTMVAVGVPLRQIGAAFVVEGGVLGALGVCVGLLAALVLSILIVGYSVPMVDGWRLAYEFPVAMAVAVSVAALMLSMAAGLFPARLAIRGRAGRGGVDE